MCRNGIHIHHCRPAFTEEKKGKNINIVHTHKITIHGKSVNNNWFIHLLHFPFRMESWLFVRSLCLSNFPNKTNAVCSANFIKLHQQNVLPLSVGLYNAISFFSLLPPTKNFDTWCNVESEFLLQWNQWCCPITAHSIRNIWCFPNTNTFWQFAVVSVSVRNCVCKARYQQIACYHEIITIYSIFTRIASSFFGFTQKKHMKIEQHILAL